MRAPAGQILVVRHGRGRGALPNYLQWGLDDIARRRPRLWNRLHFHDTGGALPGLGGVRAVVFLLADPLRERHPQCYVEAAKIRDDARAQGIRVVNDPDALSNTIKSVQASKWRAAGMSTPRHHPFTTRHELEGVLRATPFPVVLRADRLHALEGMRVCTRPDEIRALPDEAIRYPGALAEFVDVRSGYEATGQGSVWSQLFHKKRQFVFGHVTRTSHLFFSPQPLVSSRTCTFRMPPQHITRWQRVGARLAKRLPQPSTRRWKAMITANPSNRVAFELFEEALQEDIRYWEAGSEHGDVMRAAMSALELDFAAIDYSSLADGAIVLWEANPHFNLPPARQRMLPKQRRTRERLQSYGDALTEFLESLADDSVEKRARP